ncbi:MAG: TRAP transporter substrate-binding protein DctP [Deltaproteobacteria bacterium]|nr:TRAP transporter substrate-binding protein DctP [Deltaproteobacteria bacterium]
MKKRFESFLIIFFVVFMLVPAAVHAKSSGNKELRLILASYIPVGYPYFYDVQKLFVDMVNERGRGIVHLDAYFSGTLLKGKELLPGLIAGTADIIIQTNGYLLGTFPIIGFQILPVWKGCIQYNCSQKIGSDLYNFLNEELKEKNFFQLAASGAVFDCIWTKKKLVRKPSDLKGLKIRVPGKIQAMLFQAMGASPVTMASAEIPQALQRGVIDGAAICPWTAKGRGLEEFCKYMTVYPVSYQSTPIYMLRDKWESWPAEVKNLILEVAVDWEKRVKYFGYNNNALMNDGQLTKEIIPFFKKKGMQAVFLTNEEKNAFVQAAEPVIKGWVNDVGEERGRRTLMFIKESLHNKSNGTD